MTAMRIILLSQDEPFYLGENLDYLLKNLPDGTEVVGAVLMEEMKAGKPEPFTDRMRKIFKVFGWAFFLHYAFKFITAKVFTCHTVPKVLSRHKIPVIPIAGNINHRSNLGILKTYQPDLFVSVLGSQIFKRPLLELAKHGCLNLHTALLPKYRGLMPTFWVLRFNEQFTGVSVFFVEEGIDAGDIIVQRKVEIGNRTQEELIRYTKQIGMECIIEAIGKIQAGGYTLVPNPEDEKTYFTFPTAEDVRAFKRAGKRFF